MDRIHLVGGGIPAVPDAFLASLRAYDPTLLVRWNQPPSFSKRQPGFVIEQCIRHLAPGSEHSHVCQRSYVMTCRAADGSMLPLGDAILNEIKRRDVTKAGFGPEDHARFCRANHETLMTQRAKIERDQAEAVRHASRLNRRQLLQAIRLMGKHDLRVNQ